MKLSRPFLSVLLILSLFAVSCKKDGPDAPPPPLPLEPDAFWELSGVDTIVDAEYDKIHQRIVAVSVNPDQVMVIDPVTRSVVSIALNADPTCVSVSEDGSTAVVGHDGWVSWIDLSNNTLISTISAGCNVFDIVQGPNGYAYAFPATGQWTSIFSIQLSTGTVTTSDGSIYDKTNARLKPASTRIYGVTTNLSPSDVHTYDISQGTAENLYDSPYHGNYPMGGPLWFTETGDRLFTSGRTVLSTSMTQATDMQYVSNLVGTAHIRTMDHSAEVDRLYTITAWKPFELEWNGGVQVDTAINVYTGQFLDFLGTITLPRTWRNGAWHRLRGTFGAFNADGSQFHVIMSTAIGNGDRLWAVTTIDAVDP